MNAVIYPLAALVAWSAALYKLREVIRKPSERDLIPLVSALTILGIVFTISTPAVWVKIDEAAGWPNLSFLLSQTCVMVWTVIVQVMMVLWAYPPPVAAPKVKIRLLIAAVTIAIMVTLFLLAPKVPEDSTNFAARFAGVKEIAAYLCVYTLAFAWMQGEIVVLCLRTSRVGGRIWLRRGLRATAVGAVLGLVYCVVRASDVVFGVTGLANPVQWEDVARLAVGIGVILPPIGWTMPSWGPRLDEARLWVGNVVNYWRLYPLWLVLYAAFPDKDLDPPEGLARRIALRDLSDWRLPRRLVLIWDCILELQPYQNAGEQQPVTGLAGRGSGHQTRSERATEEAGILLAALAVHQRDGASALAVPAVGSSLEITDGLVSSELRPLVDLSRAVRRHPGWGSATPAAKSKAVN